MPKTILADTYINNARSWTRFQDWELPLEFSGFRQEYEAVRQKAGLIDLSFRGRLAVTGKDRVNFFHRLLSIDVKNLKTGECVTGCFLTGTAKIQCLVDVMIRENEIWLDTHESKASDVAALFEKFHFNEDVRFEDITNLCGEIAIEGPESDQHISGFPADCVFKKSISGEKGFRVWIRPGASLPNLPWVGFKALEALRIEAGEPYFGIDVDESTLQPETGRDDWASTTKGCYAGQEIIQRVRNFGHPSRLLIRLEADLPENIIGEKITAGGAEAGIVTSSAISPRTGKTIALGFVPYGKNQFEVKGKTAVILER